MSATVTHTWVAAVEERMKHRDYETALKLLRREADARAGTHGTNDRWTMDALCGECLAFLGRYQEALSVSRQVARALQQGDDHGLYARACFSMSVAQYYLGDLEAACESANLALFTYKRIDAPEGEARALNWLGNILFDRSEYRQAIASYRACADIALRHGLPRWVAVANSNTARTHLLTGHLAEAKETLRGVREFHAENGDVLSVIRFDLSASYADILGHRFAEAEATLQRLRAERTICSYPREEGIWYEYMGELEFSRGRLDAAAAQLECAVSRGVEISSETIIGQSRRLLAEVRLAQGDLDGAIAEGERALVSIRKVGERFEEGAVHRVFGEVCSRRGEVGEAARAFRQSVHILRSIGAQLEWGKSCLSAGRCPLLSNRERLAYLMEAERLFDEVGVSYWVEQTDSELVRISEDTTARIYPRNGDSRNGKPTFVAEDASTVETLRLAERYARSDIAILITGETGTGKDLLARYIHGVSPRHEGPFVSVDLNTIPEALWESELFGHSKGTFTGAAGAKPGLLETAAGGTVFLNEIGDLAVGLQAKLLELLDTKHIRRLGETASRALDVRFIAATNRDLREAVDKGIFRADLFFRLEQAPLHLASLRDRRGDVLPLIRHFLAEFTVPAHCTVDLADQSWVRRALQAAWDGNVRQLRNFLWRLATLTEPNGNGEFARCAEELLDRHPVRSREQGDPGSADQLSVRLRTVLERNNWNQRASARELGISEGGVRHRMRRWDVMRPGLERSPSAPAGR
ncbi:MAG: sigma 54-interacting transcriptional regulator [Candidatus Zixiibacteriota bacterium]